MTQRWEEPVDVRRPRRPWWVALGLWGLPVRAAALAFFWLAIGLAVLSIPAGFLFPPAWVGTLFVFSAL
jgi:hypothetical protein